MDFGYHAATAQGGDGVVVRDEVGFCLAVFSRSFLAVLFSSFHMELEACRTHLLIAIHQGWYDVEFESECLSVIKVLNGLSDDYLVELWRIVGSICLYLISFVFDRFFAKQIVWLID